MQSWVKLHTRVWFDARLRIQHRDVWLALADLTAMADEEGLVDVPFDELVAIMRVTQQSAEKSVAVLDRLGLIRVEYEGVPPRWRRAWVVSVERDAHYTRAGRAGGMASRERLQRLAATPQPTTPAAHHAAPPPEPAPPKPRKKRVDGLKLDLPLVLDYPDVREALVDYLATRKGGPWDEALARVKIRILEGWGRERAVAALRHSAGYEGLFEPNGRAPQGPRNQGADIGRKLLHDMERPHEHQ